MRDQKNAIEVINMSKDFKRVFDKPNTLKERLVFWRKSNAEIFHVLKNVNLNIKKGETVALIGVNGSGKSTLLKLMTKILYPNKGSLETNGKLTSLLELGAGFHPDFTGRENIYFNASIFGLTRKEIDARVDDIINFSELGNFIDNPVRTYSSGMYMRLAFSVAINVDAEILLIDEILAVGDQHFQDKCFSKLEELRDSDRTIVIVSHSLETLQKLCNRAIWIYDGEVKLDGEAGFVIEEYLKRVIFDHQDDGVIVKKEKYEGVVYIDQPSSFSKVDRNKKLEISGWELDDCYNSSVHLFVDKKELGTISRKERMDVFHVYENQFGGYANNKLPGWEVTLDTDTLEEGSHLISVQVFDDREQLICSKDITVYAV